MTNRGEHAIVAETLAKERGNPLAVSRVFTPAAGRCSVPGLIQCYDRQ